MVRIQLVELSNEPVRLRAEGRLTGSGVEELERTCDLHAGWKGKKLILDLHDVTIVDKCGIEFLKELMKAGAVTLNISAFLTTQACNPESRPSRE